MARNVNMTVDEIIAYLKKSNLINILVEGPDDVMVYNWLEEKINISNARILPCGGRSSLIKVFNRRNEFCNKKSVFIADKDLWVFSGVPNEYKDIIFTTGYSIENDLYYHSVRTIKKILNNSEFDNFETTINNIAPWYCSEVSNYLTGKECKISYHLNTVVSEGLLTVCENFLHRCNFSIPPTSLVEEVLSDNYIKLRGKFIYDAIIKQINTRKKSKYSRDNIFELCLKLEENPLFDRIINEVKKKVFPSLP